MRALLLSVDAFRQRRSSQFDEGRGPRTRNPGAPPATGGREGARASVGMTQEQFAARFGFSTATLRHWERGDRSQTAHRWCCSTSSSAIQGRSSRHWREHTRLWTAGKGYSGRGGPDQVDDRQCSCGHPPGQGCCGAVAQAGPLGHPAGLHLPAHRRSIRLANPTSGARSAGVAAAFGFS